MATRDAEIKQQQRLLEAGLQSRGPEVIRTDPSHGATPSVPPSAQDHRSHCEKAPLGKDRTGDPGYKRRIDRRPWL